MRCRSLRSWWGRRRRARLRSGFGEGGQEALLGGRVQVGAKHPGAERGERLDRPLGIGAAADDEQGRTARLERLVGVALFATGTTVGVLTGGSLLRRACASSASASPPRW
jgi:hypothetical protein